MWFLIISILLNTYVGIIFRHFEKYNINLLNTIVINYAVCVIVGCIVSNSFPLNPQLISQSFIPWAILLGTMFIIVFNLIAFSTIKNGVTITQASNKLSLAIPVLFAILFLGDKLNVFKIIGVLLALCSVYLINKTKQTKVSKEKALWQILPLFIFIGSGSIDIISKYVEKTYISSEIILNHFLIFSFFVAAFLGGFIIFFRFLIQKKKVLWKEIILGIILGIPNYFSIYFLIKALKSSGLSASAAIPINNIGIVICVTFYGFYIFKEKLSKVNFLGLIMAIISILFIYFGN